MPSPPTSILVLGAGELGIQVLHSLTTHPSLDTTKITLLLRPSTLTSPSPSKKAELASYRASNIALLPGDITSDTESHLSSLFAPFDTIISCTGMALPPGTQLKLTRAILSAGSVKRYFPWQFGVDYDAIGRASAQDLFDEQLAVRELLRGQTGVEWVIVSTGMFMSFLFEEAFGVVDLRGGKATVTALGSWENRLTVTAVEDIGRVVAELALVGGGERGVVFVAGDTVSMARLADVVDGLLGWGKVERSVKTVEQLEQELLESPDDVMRKYRAVFAAGVGVSWDKENSFNAKRGMDMVLVEDWAKVNVAVPQA